MRTAELRERVHARLSVDRTRANLERLSQLAKREPLRTLHHSISGFSRDNCTLWASALTYTSSLSLVPILAVGLSAVKGLVGIDRIKPLIERYLAVNSPEIAEYILRFVGNINAKALGALGGAALLVTVVLTLGTIEQSFNNIFHVPRGRTWLRKFSDYLSVTFTMPLLMAAALGLHAQLVRQLPLLPGLANLAALMPLWAGFSFLYMFFPNTRVRWYSAAIGGLAAALMLQLGQWGYIRFQIGAANYQAIYGAVASVPILLTWIYISWVIVLYGAELTAVVQGIEAPLELNQGSPNVARVAALLTVLRAGERMLRRDGVPPCTVRSLAIELGVAEKSLEPVLGKLRRAGIVVESAEVSPDHTPPIMLARDTSAIPLVEVLSCVEGGPSKAGAKIASLLEELSAAERERLGTLTVNDLARGRCELSETVPLPLVRE